MSVTGDGKQADGSRHLCFRAWHNVFRRCRRNVDVVVRVVLALEIEFCREDARLLPVARAMCYDVPSLYPLIYD